MAFKKGEKEVIHEEYKQLYIKFLQDEKRAPTIKECDVIFGFPARSGASRYWISAMVEEGFLRKIDKGSGKHSYVPADTSLYT